MVSSALRAANRWLQSLVCTAYPLNGAILLAAILAPQPTLVGFSWAFLAGSAIGAAFAYGFVRQQFGKPTQTADECARQKVWKEINRSIHDDAGVGKIGRAPCRERVGPYVEI